MLKRSGLLFVGLILAIAGHVADAADPEKSATDSSASLTQGFTLQPLHYEVQHPYDLKLEDRYSYDKAADTHDLWVLASDKPHAPPPNKTAARTEFRLKDENYKFVTGLHMLDCDMFIVPGTFACISQVFGTGPMAMIVVDKDGTISDLRTHQVIAKEMNGKWFNWKVIHDSGAEGKGAIKIYIDGKLADGDVSAKKQTSYYFKCGLYSRHGSDRSEIKIRSLNYWVKAPAESKADAATAIPASN
jgi:hypothetical protein